MKHDKHSSSGRGADSKRSKGKEKDPRGKPRHAESADHEGYYADEGYYPPMASSYHPEQPYPYPYPSHHQPESDQQAYYSQNAPAASSASAGPSLSAILNHSDPADDYPAHYPSSSAAIPTANPKTQPPPDSRVGSSGSMASSSAASNSKMALHNALSPVVPSTPSTSTSTTASGPADSSNSFASVVLSDQRSVTSASDVTYTSSHTHAHAQTHAQTHTYRSRDGYATYASAEDFQKGKANLDYNYYHSDAYQYAHEQYAHEQYPASSRGTDRRASSSSRGSKHHHNAAASYTSEVPVPLGPPGPPGPPSSSRGDKGKKLLKGSASSTSKGQRGRGRGHSHLYAATPSSSSPGVSSPAFSAPDTPGQQTPRLVSVGPGGYESSDGENDYGDDDNDDRQGRRRDASSSAPSLGRPGSEQRQPAVQRERNRVAATKCRAKSKAAISKLEEEERFMSDKRQALAAQKSALVDEMLHLREELLRHGACENGTYIKRYIDNAAHTIAESGGRNPIWGPDGTGKPWGEHHEHGHDHDHDHEHRHGHVKKERKRK